MPDKDAPSQQKPADPDMSWRRELAELMAQAPDVPDAGQGQRQGSSLDGTSHGPDAAVSLRDPVLMVTNRAESFDSIRRFVESLGGTVILVEELPAAKQHVLTGERRFSFLLCDLDACGGLDDAFDDLRHIRDQANAVAVILFADGTRDCTGTWRLPICDASLPTSVSLARFDVALGEATQNNLIWQARCREMFQDL